LPVLVSVFGGAGRRVEAMLHPEPEELLGINTRADLALATRALYRRKAEEMMLAGVTLIDPDTTYVDAEAEVGPDTVLHPNVRIEGRSRLRGGVVVRSGSGVTG